MTTLAASRQTATVHTPSFRLAQAVADQAVQLGRIALISGDPGLGKTYAVGHFVRHQPLPWTWLAMPPRPTAKELAVRLLSELQGSCDTRAPAYELDNDLLAHLGGHRQVLVVDEAQNLNMHGLNKLRWLHDNPDTDFGLLLVGGSGVEDKVDSTRELSSRARLRARFEPLAGATLLATLHELHPLLAAADDDLLTRIDRRFAHGFLREWATLLDVAAPIAERLGTPDRLTAKAAGLALVQLGAGPRDGR